MALTDFFTQIADSIRSKDGTTDVIKATDFPQRILDIPSGGGGSELPSNIHTGTFTFAEDTTENVIVEHGFSNIPYMACFCVDEYEEIINGMTIGGVFVNGMGYGFAIRTNGTLQSSNAYMTISVDDTYITFNRYREDSSPFRSGYTYRWFVWG